MPRALSLAVFIGAFSSVLGGLHYYVWARLVRDAGLEPGAQRLASIAFGVLFTSLPVGVALIARRPRRRIALVSVSYIWLGFFFLLLCATLASEVVRVGVLFGGWLLADALPFLGERPALDSTLASATALTAGVLGAAALIEGRRLHVQRLRVELARLPASLSGTTIAQWSDVHIGPTLRRSFVEALVARTNALKPDVIVITGDLVDGSVAELRSELEPLRGLSARSGVFFVTGNHEYYSGVDEWCHELERLGVRVLRNERVTIGDGASSFDLAGIDDYQGTSFGGGHGPDLVKALAGRDPSRELVLLAHQPRAIFEAERHGVGLQLSGHTHGGQIWPWGYLVRLQQPFIRGRVTVGSAELYVSSGTGFWGPPMRLGAPAEITLVTLMTLSERDAA